MSFATNVYGNVHEYAVGESVYGEVFEFEVAGEADDVITTRLQVIGTSQRTLTLQGTSQVRRSLIGTSQQGLKVRGTSP